MVTNLLAARTVLLPTGWRMDDIFGREFLHSDLAVLAELGSGDPSFAWERETMGFDYFEALLKFRLNHYRKYGFGVHGIWRDGNLIGQYGLQVLDVHLDRIECAVFLGQAYTQKGLGWKLLRHLVRLCKSSGMSELFGVARPDNPGAIALMHKLNAIAVKKVLHFNREAIVFRVDLTQFIE